MTTVFLANSESNFTYICLYRIVKQRHSIFDRILYYNSRFSYPMIYYLTPHDILLDTPFNQCYVCITVRVFLRYSSKYCSEVWFLRWKILGSDWSIRIGLGPITSIQCTHDRHKHDIRIYNSALYQSLQTQQVTNAQTP